jgi:mRNA-degrading endonuclease YafQ of YafQ-DinJ toxin-antitoxin module
MGIVLSFTKDLQNLSKRGYLYVKNKYSIKMLIIYENPLDWVYTSSYVGGLVPLQAIWSCLIRKDEFETLNRVFFLAGGCYNSVLLAVYSTLCFLVSISWERLVSVYRSRCL